MHLAHWKTLSAVTFSFLSFAGWENWRSAVTAGTVILIVIFCAWWFVYYLNQQYCVIQFVAPATCTLSHPGPIKNKLLQAFNCAHRTCVTWTLLLCNSSKFSKSIQLFAKHYPLQQLKRMKTYRLLVLVELQQGVATHWLQEEIAGKLFWLWKWPPMDIKWPQDLPHLSVHADVIVLKIFDRRTLWELRHCVLKSVVIVQSVVEWNELPFHIVANLNLEPITQEVIKYALYNCLF